MTELAPGKCGMCGCTEGSPCEGGCSWADPGKTLCSKCAASPQFAVSAAALELAMLAAQMQRALYNLEAAWERLTPEPAPFSEAFADAARLHGYLAESIEELLEPFPKQLELARSERRIITPP